MIEKMNRLKGRKIAVDIPSGIHSGNGQVMGIAFRADLTVTFQFEKLGMVLFPGKEYTGKTAVVDIGIHSSVFSETQEVAYTLERADLSRMLPKRKPDTHKGSYGKVLMITGSKGMAGAAYLSALAAYTCGAGLVQIYTDETNRAILQPVSYTHLDVYKRQEQKIPHLSNELFEGKELRDVLSHVHGRANKLALIYQLVVLAYADGIYSPGENDALRRICAILHIEFEKLYEILELVEEYQQFEKHVTEVLEV